MCENEKNENIIPYKLEQNTATNGVRGLYSPHDFYMDLSEDIMKNIENLNKDDSVQAEFIEKNIGNIVSFSTYLHETIHWWQHIGSSSGFLQSLSSFSLVYECKSEIKKIISEIGNVKPLIKFYKKHCGEKFNCIDSFNVLINDYLDINFAINLILKPSKLSEFYKDYYFLGRGHCFSILYAISCNILSISSNGGVITDPDSITKQMRILKAKNYPEFSGVAPSSDAISSIGLYEIFEGQAIFNQIQYLSLALGDESLVHFEEQGYLHGVYRVAFDKFLYYTGLAFPEKTISKEVGIFLLICDLSINPTSCFPGAIENFEEFIPSVDPGTRFSKLCKVIRNNKNIINKLNDLSKGEYCEISEFICEKAGIKSPTEIFREVSMWPEMSKEINEIMEEGRILSFSAENMPVRLILYKFVEFYSNKYKNPDFFCWIGYKLASSKLPENGMDIWLSQQTLFTKRSDKPGVFVRNFPNIKNENLVKTLGEFYNFLVLRDLTVQMVMKEGNFDMFFDKFVETDTNTSYEWAQDIFKNVYDVTPEEFKVL
ncbi:hypothetical protein [Acetobacter orleanensis]|uniref:Uncharacterized protein n=3 Tax=Acetobacter orleanensis TaxID=104099 RepID=A0A4Y3TTH4_9PROT|nr:hypothetical protein [Acetobacter orleanensis]GAN69485.1 hypothetical protein Abol_037_002 [Acetobacter orleanensis JCM 7639]GEB84085.1 hypothetical protein AOR01nite_25620 [Acetobacter orleanensis]